MSEPLLIFETVTGSRAYGLERAGSDTDLRGVIVGPRAWYLGFVGGPEQVQLGKDHVRWELRKFLRLAAAGNPSILEVLWTDPRFFVHTTPWTERLLEAKALSMSRRIAGSFGEYAMSQLKRIKTHRSWLLSPPREEPTRAMFGLPERTVLPKDQLGAVEALIAEGRLEEADVGPNFLEVLERERRYRAARQGFEQYRTWTKNRNPDRAALEAKHGYDTKHAAVRSDKTDSVNSRQEGEPAGSSITHPPLPYPSDGLAAVLVVRRAAPVAKLRERDRALAKMTLAIA